MGSPPLGCSSILSCCRGAFATEEEDERDRGRVSLVPPFVVDMLNGISQVCFLTNSVSGAIFSVSLLLGSPRAAVILSMAGALSSTGWANYRELKRGRL